MRKAWILTTLSALSCTTMLSAHVDYSLNDHWSLLADFVFMRRSKVPPHSLVKDTNKTPCRSACPDYTVIDDGDLVNDFDFEPGYRVGLTYMDTPKSSYEINYLYLTPWEGKKTAHGNQSLYFFSNADYTQDFVNADKAEVEYTSHYWDVEFNYWRHFTPRRVDYFSVSGIAGLRYFHLNESFSLNMITPPDESSYDIHTKNSIIGVQLGVDFQMNPMHWFSWEIFAKAGGMANHTEQKQFLGDVNNTVELRDSKRTKRTVGVFTDVAAQMVFRFKQHYNFHAGYQCLFFSGLALAPGQISKKTGSNAGKKDHTNGTAIIHGLFLGFGFTF